MLTRGSLQVESDETSSAPCLARFRITGMHCGACSSAVEFALTSVEGVTHAVVSIATHEAEVRYRRGATTPELIIAAVDECGFEASLLAVREENVVRSGSFLAEIS